MAADRSKPCSLESAWFESSTNPFKSQCVASNVKTGPQLKIVTRKQLRRFLQVIQPEFLRVVNPRESGMLDILMAADLLTDTDHESMSGKDVNCRKDQARKLWILLNKMSVANFVSQVAPELLRQFFHIVPEEFILKEGEQMPTEIDEHEECLRHDIMSRVREETLADMLYHHGCLSFEDYEDVVSGEFDKDVVWQKLLDSFSGHPDDVTVQLLRSLQEVLEKYSLPVPDDLSKLLSRGLPCTCGKEFSSLPVGTPLPIRKVSSWMKKSGRSSGTSYIPNSQYTSYRSQASSGKSSTDIQKSGGVAFAEVVEIPNNSDEMFVGSATGDKNFNKTVRSNLCSILVYPFAALGFMGCIVIFCSILVILLSKDNINDAFTIIDNNFQIHENKIQAIIKVIQEIADNCDHKFELIRSVFNSMRLN